MEIRKDESSKSLGDLGLRLSAREASESSRWSKAVLTDAYIQIPFYVSSVSNFPSYSRFGLQLGMHQTP